MHETNVKIQFDTNQNVLEYPDILLWDNFEEKVRKDINNGKGDNYIVYLKHQMPLREMDNIILELCDRIAWDGHSPISYGSIEKRYTFLGGSICDEIITKASYQFIV